MIVLLLKMLHSVSKKIQYIPKIISLLKPQKLNQFVEDLEGNKKTNLGEYGDKISGGQKQRLGIARAFIQ